MTNRTHLALGDLISLFYEEYLLKYGDEEIASVAAAATVNELLAAQAAGEDGDHRTDGVEAA